MDPQTEEKIKFLESSGFRYMFDRDVFSNVDSRKCVSLEYAEDHSLAELRELVASPNETGRWLFYFNVQPSPTLQTEMSQVLDRAA